VLNRKRGPRPFADTPCGEPARAARLRRYALKRKEKSDVGD
jgi:hypothetical protein